jgi:predicted dehydrogenase
MPESLRGGVIGAGVFGGYHARQYSRIEGVTLSAVFDPHPQRAAEVAMPLGGRAFHDLKAFLDAVDVVTVASPATVHGGQALAVLQAGKPVYVEKPIAVTLAEAQAVRAAGEAAGKVVACGHQERVIFRAMGLLDIPEQPLRLEAVRHGLPSPRCQDVSAVLDLMIHDLDLALSISAASPAQVQAQGGWNGIHTEIAFDDGFVAAFEASREAEARKRTMKVVYPSGEVELDFLTREFRNTTPFALNPDFADAPAGRDPLGASVEGFLAAVQGRAPRPIVTADEAIRALDLGLRVEKAAGI